MRIAFVGKGGSGKTTLAALFSLYIQEENKNLPVLVVDADINMHLKNLLGIEAEISESQHISHPQSAHDIKEYLIGSNKRIQSPAHFKKTTPPANNSNFIVIHNPDDYILGKYSVGEDLKLMTVGSYDTENIGASCYHNNLAIFENVLSHLIDTKGILVADMVAGVDAFSNSLHAQFDLITLVVEPTQRGVGVYKQYELLAQAANVFDHIFVVGNKIRSKKDEEFLTNHIPKEKILGFFYESDYLREMDQLGGKLDINGLEDVNKKVLGSIAEKLTHTKTDYEARLKKLHQLHLRYIKQGFVVDILGDLSGQIDEHLDISKLLQTTS